MMVDYVLVSKILNLILIVAGMYFGAKYKRIKKVIEDIATALEDDEITPDEIKKIINDVIGK